MTYTQEQWNLHKAEIYSLYYNCSFSIDQVVYVMKSKGFKARLALLLNFNILILILSRRTKYFAQFKI